MEIQIRTIAMNCWASCEHQLHYKKGFELSPDAINKLKACADSMNEMDRTVQELADEILGQ